MSRPTPEKHRENARRWRANNSSEKKALVQKRSRLKVQYGLSMSAYEAMFQGQGNVCAICKAIPNPKRVAVDHDHKTGIIRGILCHLCNTAIGLMKDNPEILIEAAKYLRERNGTAKAQ